MIFRERNGSYEGVFADGKTVAFEDEREMRACAEVRAEIFKMLGKGGDVILVNASVGEVEKSKPVRHIKNVRIFIDPDVEYLGNEKALA